MLRGLSIFACGLEEASRLNDGDPIGCGRAGCRYELMEWWVAAGSLTFPRFDGEVGSRRSMDTS